MKKALLVLLLSLFLTSGLTAGEWTDVLDAFDKDNPYDIQVKIDYSYWLKKALIDREQVCIASQSSNCTSNEIILIKELNYKRFIHFMNINLSLGLYHDLEFFAKFPIILQEQAQYTFQNGVSQANSTVYPKSNPNNFLFVVPYNGPIRKGFGDMSIGVKWEPFNQERDPEEGNWVLGLEAIIPTGDVKKGGNEGVGYGIFALKFFTVLSREYFNAVEPYFEAHGKLNFPTSKSLFKNYGDTQTLFYPGNNLGIKAGVELVPWQIKATKQKVSFDFGVGADYIFEGREYSELFEGLANSSCQGCDVLKEHSGAQTDGITDVSHYAFFHGWAGITIKPVKYFSLKFYFNYSYEKSHFLTNADSGKDLNNNGKVEKTNAIDEFNPVYNENYDKIGKRFVVDGVNIFMFTVSIAGTL